MKRFVTSLLMLGALIAMPFAFTGCTADSLTGPDGGAYETGTGGSGSTNTGPDRDILDCSRSDPVERQSAGSQKRPALSFGA